MTLFSLMGGKGVGVKGAGVKGAGGRSSSLRPEVDHDFLLAGVP